jgi:drug/metabolite transporter (DMT)-like permease
MDRLWWLLLVLATWGLGNFLLKPVGMRLDNSSGALGILTGYVITGLIFGIGGGGRLGLTWGHGMAALVGACYIVGNWAFLHMSRTEDITTLAPLASLAIIVPIVLGFLVLGEPFSIRKLVGIVFALVAMVLLS